MDSRCLKDKDGNPTDKLGIAVRSSSQELAIDINEAKILDWHTEPAQELRRLLVEAYANGGAKAADKVAGRISQHLSDGMQLKIREDKELTKREAEKAKVKGEKEPEYIRFVELIDKKGESLGEWDFVLSAKKKTKGKIT